LAGAIQVGDAVVLPVNVPPPSPAEHEADQPYEIAWLSESVAVTVSATLPEDATGFGEPEGPLVMVSSCGIEFTSCEYEAVCVNPCTPSLTLACTLQVCVLPLALTGAVHVGVAVAAPVKLPPPMPPPQLAVHP
jgi:hypothetical protein